MSTPKDRPLSSERERFLNLRHLPAQINRKRRRRIYLGCIPHEIPVLVAKGFLKPLGNPADNAVKYFALSTLEELRADVKWLSPRQSGNLRLLAHEERRQIQCDREFIGVLDTKGGSRHRTRGLTRHSIDTGFLYSHWPFCADTNGHQNGHQPS